MPLAKLYQNMVAGCLPKPTGDIEDMVAMTALNALKTAANIHTMIALHEGYVYYLAVPSAELASHRNFSTPLAAALPNHPDHRGDGAYVLYLEQRTVAVFRRDNKLHLLCNEPNVIEDAVIQSDLPVVDVEKLVPWPLESAVLRARASGQRLSEQIMKYGSYWAIGASVVAAGCLIASAVLTSREDASQLVGVDKLVRGVSLSQPLNQDLANLQKVANLPLKLNGWMERYQLVQGAEAYELILPSWTSKDHIDSLGAGVTTLPIKIPEFKDMSLVQVRKGSFDRKPAPKPVEAPAKTEKTT
jgi:hypothetical protein